MIKIPEICVIKGPAGKQELAELIKFAGDGWNIAFMDPVKETGEQLKQKLKDEYNINVNVLTEKESKENAEFDIEGFFYHGSWDDEEDVDIFWGFLEGKYGKIGHIIGD